MSTVISSVIKLAEQIKIFQNLKKTIAFVPTMGGLHQGHLSLVDIAKKKADIVVVSIFVNPTQFGKNEDFDKYPNTLANDKYLLEERGVNVIFTPSIDEIYPKGYQTNVEVSEIANLLCAASRPGHFQGVVQVVKRLFELVKPNVAVFGEKDYQQLLVIKDMVERYQMNIAIISAPIVRETDGLAMSTRNQYLSKQERQIAPKVYQVLEQIKKSLQRGESINTVSTQAKNNLEQDFKLDYLEVLDANTLKQINDNTTHIAVLCAVFLGSTRLIDNIVFAKE